MIKMYLTGVLICISLFSFKENERRSPAEDLVGSWQVLKMDSKDEAMGNIQFQLKGNNDFKVLSADGTSPIAEGTWGLAKESVLVASEPFVYQDEYILQFHLQTKTVSLDLPEEMRIVQIKRSKILTRYVKNKRQCKITLKRMPGY
jgi:hypothetical protein